MATRLVAILIVLLLARFLPELARLRDYGWWRIWFERAAASSPGSAAVLCVGVPVLVCAFLQWGLRGHLFGLISCAFAAIVLFYCWGPRDLERDAEALEKAPDSERRAAAAQALGADSRSAPVALEAEALVTATFESALKRWFGVLFWFALLGPAGALLYRLLQLCASTPAVAETQSAATLRRVVKAFDWLPAHLVALALAVASNFDAVFKTWRDWHATRTDRFELDPGFLDAIARASVDADVAASDEEYGHGNPHAPMVALSDAMVLVRRVLIVWLTVIALIVLGGWFG
jgi:AmpE protein